MPICAREGRVDAARDVVLLAEALQVIAGLTRQQRDDRLQLQPVEVVCAQTVVCLVSNQALELEAEHGAAERE
jgi:hypothetical protein